MFDYYRFAGPLIRLLPAEAAHNLSIAILKTGLAPRQPAVDDPALKISLWGREFPNPIGLAAGYDKNAEVPDALLTQGFGFIEVGTVTPQPQPGNPKPRLFRLVGEKAVINRMGFNNQGAQRVAGRLARRRSAGIVGVNLGKNKTTEDAAADYEKGVRILGPLSDYLVINVSSPNTPGLRALQSRSALEDLVGRVRHALHELPSQPPLLLKIAPDLGEDDQRDIAEVVLAAGLDGLIVTNTTIGRPDGLVSKNKTETGGLSGPPLFEPSTRMLREMYRLTGGRLPLIGVGGITTGAEAYAKIRAGASLLQIYTALIYHGTVQVTRINRELSQLLHRDGFRKLADAVGADHPSAG
ncbi:quinone-dependent dihydroorotate dehydrogenase [Telmatospirillum siberiense]|uniref:Dihydroorotate dehydrogenase (quinone) n=1 Tax=Telmatospirillum siberiense TaxID=382514 RepID=A0A2N3PPI7_9PROT|nr:quinone-dependent dihydroorotate dehydrogenase [Telmatospirillum siberiense]PKU22310.1 dihydroorotate dehydrogenase (quinone) [Telmatospirillum siberiense]